MAIIVPCISGALAAILAKKKREEEEKDAGK